VPTPMDVMEPLALPAPLRKKFPLQANVFWIWKSSTFSIVYISMILPIPKQFALFCLKSIKL